MLANKLLLITMRQVSQGGLMMEQEKDWTMIGKCDTTISPEREQA